jgi:stage V sporulation protein G
MNITEVRVRLVDDKNERLKAFCCMTIDGEFVVRDIKVIDGAKGLFVAMPSRKITDHCPKCGGKNSLRAKFCNDCGGPLSGGKFTTTPTVTDKLHADIAHPINSQCRAKIQEAVVVAYKQELDRSKQPGYTPQRGIELDEVELTAVEPEKKLDIEIMPRDETAEKPKGFADGII